MSLYNMPKTIIAANWKMHKTIQEAEEFLTALNNAEKKADRKVLNFPSATLLTVFKGKNVNYGAQNMHWEEEGAFTGELSPLMVKDAGGSYILIGHSERRQLFGETDEEVNKKLISALKHGLKPVFCIGETLDQREDGKTAEVINTQIEQGLANISDLSEIIIAYEPVWAIGTGKTATPEQAQEVHAQIREKTTPETSILYGGSVKPANISELMSQKDINGALIGGAALEIDSFVKIVNY